MPSGERDTESDRTFAPFPLHGEQAVRQLAERTMSSTQSGSDPIRHLADDRAVGVVHTDEFLHLGRHARDGMGVRGNGSLPTLATWVIRDYPE